ncbi:response regulator transcription factor [Dictyobacter arantiisoli]|nr:response regulator [Dictyobacter arantiisoli]
MAKSIIVVDDDKEIREIMTFVLMRHGFQVEAVASGQQLQRVLSFQVPDLIILDVMMPGEDGYHICRSLRANPLTCDIPVMMITAHAEDIYERISIDLGAVQHMTKPFHPLALAAKVQAILGSETYSC